MNQNKLTNALATLFIPQVSPTHMRRRPPSAQAQPMSFDWGTVTATGPVQIQVDGENSPLGYVPDSLIPVAALQVGDRVWCLNYGTYVVIMGVGGGVVATAWQGVPYSSEFADYGGTYWPLAYRLDAEGRVWMRGMAKATTSVSSGDLLGTLPAGFRPGKDELFAAQWSGSPAMELVIGADGGIRVYSAMSSGQYVSLSGMSFQIPGI